MLMATVIKIYFEHLLLRLKLSGNLNATRLKGSVLLVPDHIELNCCKVPKQFDHDCGWSTQVLTLFFMVSEGEVLQSWIFLK